MLSCIFQTGNDRINICKYSCVKKNNNFKELLVRHPPYFGNIVIFKIITITCAVKINV